ncbi:MAG: peptidylprolyl isomerase [Thermodesulfovibrionales bacterium]|nr:peptidylprolyl isomerase [Thermodesulfovibrionales bacterium]
MLTLWYKGRSRAVVLAAVLIAAVFGAAPTAAADEAVAKVNDTVLTGSDLEDAIGEIIPKAVFHGSLSPEKRASFIPKAMEIMIENELLYQEAKKRGMKVDKKRIDDAEKVMIEKSGGKKNFKAALKRSGMKIGDYEKKIERSFIIEDIMRQEIDDKAVITPDEVKAYYERNEAGFQRPEARRIRHILIKVEPYATEEEKAGKRKIAGEVLEKARAGEDFARLAWDYSDDPYRVKGGDFGLMHRGRLDPGLDAAAFGTGVGQISNVIETIYGFHIMKVEESRAPEHLALGDVSQKIESQLKGEKLKRLRESLIEGLKANAQIEVYSR